MTIPITRQRDLPSGQISLAVGTGTTVATVPPFPNAYVVTMFLNKKEKGRVDHPASQIIQDRFYGNVHTPLDKQKRDYTKIPSQTSRLVLTHLTHHER